MSRLTNPQDSGLSEGETPRERRNRLLREANRHRYRLHRMTDLQKELRQATTELLKREMAAPVDPETPARPEPLGDAGAVGKQQNGFDFYKD